MRVVARLLTLAVIVAAFSSAFAPEAAAQFAQPAAVTQQSSLTPEQQQAARAGYEAGMAMSTMQSGMFSCGTSLVFPGTGLLFIPFAGPPGDLGQDPVLQSQLRDKSTDYTRTFMQYRRDTFKSREVRTILISTLACSAAWFVVVKPAVFPKRDLGYGYY